MSEELELELLDLLDGKEEEIDRGLVEVELPEAIPITQGVLDTSHLICDLVYDLNDSHFEWYGFMLADQDDPDYVSNALWIPENVQAKPGFVSFTGEDHAAAADEIRERNEERGTNAYTIGWLHSHGNGPVGFSPEDRRNFTRLMNSVWNGTKRRGTERFDIIESEALVDIDGEDIVVSGKSLADGILRYTVPNEELFEQVLATHGLTGDGNVRVNRTKLMADILDVLDFRSYEPEMVGFGYSVVVNARQEDPYAMLGIVRKKPFSEDKPTLQIKKTKVEVVQVENDWVPSEDKLSELLHDRVTFVKPAPVKPPTKVTYVGKGNGSTSSSGSGLAYQRGVWRPNGAGYRSYTPTPRETRQKRPPTEVELETMVKQFGYKIADYLARFEDDNVLYSEYVDDMVSLVYNSRVNSGLTETIVSMGELFEDGKQVLVPTFRPYEISALIRKTWQNLPFDDNDPEIDFIFDFTFKDQNEALEKYVPILIASEEAKVDTTIQDVVDNLEGGTS